MFCVQMWFLLEMMMMILMVLYFDNRHVITFSLLPELLHVYFAGLLCEKIIQSS
ncbi:hypothetical protein DsansV1_C04g0039641 [Dioscorea sansibarensis]